MVRCNLQDSLCVRVSALLAAWHLTYYLLHTHWMNGHQRKHPFTPPEQHSEYQGPRQTSHTQDCRCWQQTKAALASPTSQNTSSTGRVSQTFFDRLSVTLPVCGDFWLWTEHRRGHTAREHNVSREKVSPPSFNYMVSVRTGTGRVQRQADVMVGEKQKKVFLKGKHERKRGGGVCFWGGDDLRSVSLLMLFNIFCLCSFCH